jgi:hypothetical protein
MLIAVNIADRPQRMEQKGISANALTPGASRVVKSFRLVLRNIE